MSVDDYRETQIKLMINLCKAVEELQKTTQAIFDLLKHSDKPLTDQDIEDRAVLLLIQVGPNLSEIVRRLNAQGITVRRHSLGYTKRFSRFQEKLEKYRQRDESMLRRGHITEEGHLEAYDE